MKTLSSFVVCLAGLAVAPAAVAAVDGCPKLLSAASRDIAVGRALGADVTMEDFGRHLRKLTGVEKIDDDKCIGDRCSLENRIRARRYIVSQLLLAGFTEDQITFETRGPKERYVGGYSSHSESDSAKKERKRRNRKKKDAEEGAGEGKVEEKTEEKTEEKAEETTEPEKKSSYEEIPPIEREVVNIIARIKGSKYPEQVIEVSSHYDTAGDGVLGADDNGSGLVTNLELATRMIRLQPESTTDFAFCDLEERGFVGSELHVEKMKERKNEKFLGAIVVDMIGYFPKWHTAKPRFVVEIGEPHHHRSREAYEKSATLGNTLIDQMRAFDRTSEPEIALDSALPGTGDHGPYWRGGFPAVFVGTIYEGDYVNPGYHKHSDNMDGMNWPFFHSVATQIMEAVARIAGAQPARELYSQHYPPMVFTEKDRDHVGQEILRVAEVRRKKEAEERRIREETERRWAEERRKREEDDRLARLARERKEQEPRYAAKTAHLPKDLEMWHFDQLVSRVKNMLKDKYKPEPKPGLGAFLAALFFGEPEANLNEDTFLDFGAEVFTASPAGPIKIYQASDFEPGNALERFREKLRSSTVELLYKKEDEDSSNASIRIRLGELVLANHGHRLKVSAFNPKDHEGYKGVVLVASPQAIDRLLLRFAHYSEFVRGSRGFGPWNAASISTSSRDDTAHVLSGAFTYDFTFTKEGEDVFVVDTDARFRVPVSLSPGSSGSVDIRFHIPTVKEYGVGVARDVLGLRIPVDAKDVRYFDAVIAGEAKLPGVQFLIDYGKPPSVESNPRPWAEYD